jgi:hypothetical protein
MRRLFAIGLLNLIALHAQSGQTPTQGFHIVVVEGEGALNNIETRAGRELAVQVIDPSGKPVTGANVEFEAPANGPGQSFANGSRSFATVTNANGIATAPAAANNGTAGAFVTNVRVFYRGQDIGKASIHQTNVSGQVAVIGSKLQSNAKTQAGGLALSANVVGVASGDQFLVNGAETPGNANLLNSTRVQTLAAPTTLFLHDNCEFLEGPRSSLLISPGAVTLESGAVRATRFGNCKLGYGGLWVAISGAAGTAADGVVAITNDAMEVASVTGELQVVNGVGELVGIVASGTVSSFALAPSGSGATVGGPSTATTRTKVLVGTTAAAAAAGLGVAISGAASSTPTSP